MTDVMGMQLTGLLGSVDAFCAEFHYYSTYHIIADGSVSGGDLMDGPAVGIEPAAATSGEGEQIVQAWDGQAGDYAPGFESRYKEGPGQGMISWKNAERASEPNAREALVRSAELEVVNDIMEENGLRLYTPGYAGTRMYLGASLAEACWGRPLATLTLEQLAKQAELAHAEPVEGKTDQPAAIDLVLNARATLAATSYNQQAEARRSAPKSPPAAFSTQQQKDAGVLHAQRAKDRPRYAANQAQLDSSIWAGSVSERQRASGRVCYDWMLRQ
jgi:hypothetical protein